GFRPPAPPGPPVEKLRACSGENEQRPLDLADERLLQVAEVVFGPVQILEQEDDRPVADQLGEELRPGVVEALARRERRQRLAGVESERQTQPAALAESLEHHGRRIAIEKTEVLTQDLRERPIRRPVPV